MSVYKASLDAVNLDSHWSCSKVVNDANPAGYWAITSGPHEASVPLVFPVEIPAGAIIARAWISLNAEELMLLNCGVGEDSCESLGLQGDPTSPS